MMKTIVIVNSNNYASTGNVMLNTAKVAREHGYKVYTCCRNSRAARRYDYEDQIYIGTWLDRVISERLAYLTGLNGYFNIINTWLFIRKLKKLKPDLIQVHSMCDNYLNVSMFYRYIRDSGIPMVWTLHDGWAFTGRCALFRCEKWMEGCGNCPHLEYFPPSLFLDNTARVLKKREKLYRTMKNMTLVTPSKWLAELSKISIFKEDHPVRVINNGIDLDVFKPTESDFRQKYGLQDKYVLLGVAYNWDKEKGRYALTELAKVLPDDYRVVMVGTNDEFDREFPDTVISIHKTFDRKELVEIYSSADLYVNPTTDENFPTVNIEALACGLPVLTYATGGSAEIIDEKSGSSVRTGDFETLIKEIRRICETRPYKKEDCLRRAADFNMHDKFREYLDLYEEILSGSGKV